MMTLRTMVTAVGSIVYFAEQRKRLSIHPGPFPSIFRNSSLGRGCVGWGLGAGGVPEPLGKLL